jgi:putative phosphatase
MGFTVAPHTTVCYNGEQKDKHQQSAHVARQETPRGTDMLDMWNDMLNNAIANNDEWIAAERRQAKREAAADNDTNLLDAMASNELVRVKESGIPGVVACNFTRKAFYKGAWDAQTVRARGLFLDKNTGEVVARGYDKFFNVGQSGAPATIRDLATEATREAQDNEHYNVTMRKKHNGFLAIVAAVNGNLVVLSKSGVTAYSREAERILRAQIGDAGCERLRRILDNNNLSATFECISRRDPHMVYYTKDEMIFLDFIHNTPDYDPVPLDAAFTTIRTVDPLMPVAESKTLAYWWMWENATDLAGIITRMADRASHEHAEGYVVSYGDGRMAKIKTEWYTRAKWLRPMVQNAILRDNYEPSKRESAEITRMRKLLTDAGVLSRDYAERMGMIVEDVTGDAITLDYPEWLRVNRTLLDESGYFAGGDNN